MHSYWLYAFILKVWRVYLRVGCTFDSAFIFHSMHRFWLCFNLICKIKQLWKCWINQIPIIISVINCFVCVCYIVFPEKLMLSVVVQPMSFELINKWMNDIKSRCEVRTEVGVYWCFLRVNISEGPGFLHRNICAGHSPEKVTVWFSDLLKQMRGEELTLLLQSRRCINFNFCYWTHTNDSTFDSSLV